MEYCSYFQAIVKKEDCWYLTAILRSCEHLAFDRTVDTAASRFEFFVAPELEQYFVQLMQHFIDKGMVTDFQKLSNRLRTESVVTVS